MAESSRRFPRLLSRGSWPESVRIADILRQETIGGALLMMGAAVALAWSNSPWSGAYVTLRDVTFGPAALHLELSAAAWASDGLLAIFFFVAGLELKREFVAGDLRDPRRAAVPVAAAVGGVIVPAVLYAVVNVTTTTGQVHGWAIPTATDIAFALAVLAVVGRHLPPALRTFLLTLAVVDNLIAITIIAIFYTADLTVTPLLVAIVPFALFTFLVQRRVRSWWLLLPLGVTVWALVHASGVHATVAGVLLGFAVPVVRSAAAGGPDAGPGLAVPDGLALQRGAGTGGDGSTGLGLDIVRKLAERVGGSLSTGRSTLGGLQVHVSLPTLASRQPQPKAPFKARVPRARRAGRGDG